MKKYIFFFILIFLFLNLKAQKVYKIDSVSHILMTGNAAYTLKQLENNLFHKRYIVIYGIDNTTVHESSRDETLEDLTKSGSTVVPISDLRKITEEEWIKKFLGNEYLLSPDNTGKADDKTFYTIEMFRPNIWLQREYKFGRSPGPPSNKEVWYISNAGIFTLAYIELPDHKTYLQGFGNNYIVPYKTGFTYGTTSNAGTIGERFDRKRYIPDNEIYTYQTVENLQTEYIYTLEKDTVNNKYGLVEKYYKHKLIPAMYDTIIRNNIFTIGRNGNKYDLYNAYLQKLVTDADAVNFDKYKAEYVKNNRLYTSNIAGDTISIIFHHHFRCGTVPHYYFKLNKDNEGNNFILETDRKKEEYPIGKTDNWNNVMFINGMEEIRYDSNDTWDLIHNRMGIGQNWIIVRKEDKYGILDIVRETTREIVVEPIVPPEYNEIVFKSYYEPLILKKDGLLQVCIGQYNTSNFGKNVPLVISPYFKEIGEQRKFFLRYEKPDGETGHYDIERGVCIVDRVCIE